MASQRSKSALPGALEDNTEEGIPEEGASGANGQGQKATPAAAGVDQRTPEPIEEEGEKEREEPFEEKERILAQETINGASSSPSTPANLGTPPRRDSQAWAGDPPRRRDCLPHPR